MFVAEGKLVPTSEATEADALLLSFAVGRLDGGGMVGDNPAYICSHRLVA